MTLSFNNVQSNSFSEPKEPDKIELEGSLIGNINTDLKTIGAEITTLAGAIFGYDKEARVALNDTINTIKDDPKQIKLLADAMLSTYNLTMDDFGKMPLGEMVGNVMSGAWKKPITSLLDVTSIASLAGVKLPKKLMNSLGKIDDADVRIRLAEQVTRDNLKLTDLGNQFAKQIDRIEDVYSPEVISKSMQAIETLGFKNAPKELVPCMQDLTKANDTYKQFCSMAGAEMLDDVDLATRELIAKQYGVTFEDAGKLSKESNLYKDVQQYVIDNDVRPLFHLKPKIKEVTPIETPVETSLLKRKFGTMDYDEASKQLGDKTADFVNKVIKSQTIDSTSALNRYIREYNKVNKTNVAELEVSNQVWSNRFLNELNAELKKTMLSGGVYLGANVLTTTLSILNNFNVDALAKTFKNLPKFRLIELGEAKTPILNLISRLNNRIYRPIASIDRYLENIAATYINNYGIDKAQFLQSTIPSKVVATNQLQSAIKALVPFGSYPLAAIKEVAAHVKGRPEKVLAYNQIGKIGEELNRQAQESIPEIREVDTSKVIRRNEQGKLVERNTVITPIQAANMFLLGTQGDAIQIPLVQFLNKLISGKGDPSVFEVNGKQYKVEQGKVRTAQGEFDLLPSLSYIGRSLLGPVQFYNQVIVPLMTDKYIKDETRLLNRMVDESQYASMTSAAKRKVTDNAKEKLGKRVLGTYEYNYYDNKRVSKSIRRKVLRQLKTRKSIDRALER